MSSLCEEFNEIHHFGNFLRSKSLYFFQEVLL